MLKGKKILFVLHSSIAELMLLQLIFDGLIEESDVKILRVRNFTPTSKLVKKLPFLELQKVWSYDCFQPIYRRRFWNTQVIKKEYVKTVKTFMNGEAYIFISPYMSIIPFYLLINDSACKGVYIFEEGIGSYGSIKKFIDFRVRGQLSFRKSLLHHLNYNGSLPSPRRFIDYEHPKLKGYFAFSPNCFRNANPRLVSWPNKKDFLKLVSLEGYQYSGCHIIIFDLFYIRHGLGESVFFLSLMGIMESFNKIGIDSKKIYYKLHPDQSADNSFLQRLIFFFGKHRNFSFERISDNISIEILSVFQTNTYYVFYSSLAVYIANNQENTVYTAHNIVSSIASLNDEKMKEEIPVDFWERVKMLEL